MAKALRSTIPISTRTARPPARRVSPATSAFMPTIRRGPAARQSRSLTTCAGRRPGDRRQRRTVVARLPRHGDVSRRPRLSGRRGQRALPGPQRSAVHERRARYVGDAVAAVAADDEYTAQRALDLIRVVYDVQEAFPDAERNLAATYAPSMTTAPWLDSPVRSRRTCRPSNTSAATSSRASPKPT